MLGRGEVGDVMREGVLYGCMIGFGEAMGIAYLELWCIFS